MPGRENMLHRIFLRTIGKSARPMGTAADRVDSSLPRSGVVADFVIALDDEPSFMFWHCPRKRDPKRFAPPFFLGMMDA